MARVVEQRIAERQQIAGRDIGVGDFFSGQATEIYRAREDVAALTTLLESLRLPSNVRVDEDIRRILKASNNAAIGLEQAQKLAESSLQAGIPAAVRITATLNRLGDEIDKSLTAIAEAQRDFAEGRKDANERDAVVAREGANIRRGRARRAQAEQTARELDFSRIVDPQGLTGSRLSRIGSNLSSAGLESGRLARQARELEARAARAQADSASNNPFVRMRSAREMQAVNQEAAALEAATMQVNRFSESLARATAEAESNINAATQRDEEARRALLTPGGGDQQIRASTKAETDVEEQRRANREVEQATALARNRLEREANDPNNPLAGTFERLRKIEEDLASGNPNVNRDELVRERKRLNDQVDRPVFEDFNVRAARNRSTFIEERQKAENRGIELAMTPAERAGKELARGLNDVESAIGSGDVDIGAGAQAQRRIIDESMRQTAPAIFNMADEVMNAVVQGPSRAALQVNDITTAQGAAELNRLLRGDDSAKNQNLIELQKQSNSLTELVTIARENGAPPGVFDN
jgi:hypothetical protein